MITLFPVMNAGSGQSGEEYTCSLSCLPSADSKFDALIFRRDTLLKKQKTLLKKRWVPHPLFLLPGKVERWDTHFRELRFTALKNA